MLIGLLLGGYCSDRFGRREIFYTGMASVMIATWVMIFPKSFIVFIVCRVVVGVGAGELHDKNSIKDCPYKY